MKIISRADAKAAGLIRFFTGVPCKHGHLCERYVSGSDHDCVKCKKIRNQRMNGKQRSRKRAMVRAWNERNPERKAAGDKAWRARNLARRSGTQRAWRKEHREYLAVVSKIWRRANPERIKANNHNRRAKQQGNGGEHTAEDIAAIFKKQKGLCVYCGANLRIVGYHVDHKMPLALGGSNAPSNLQLLCKSCNVRKNAKHPDVFASELVKEYVSYHNISESEFAGMVAAALCKAIGVAAR